MNVSRFVNNPDNPFHTSGYASAANGNRMGSTSSQSFQQRERIEKNRRAIREYRSSIVARNSPVGNEPLSSIPQSYAPRQERHANPINVNNPEVRKITFTEPTSRSYNPYG
jgi:hypothetical protein